MLNSGAAVLGAIDYKWTFAQNFDSEDEEQKAYSQCHTRSAQRVLRALLANGGAYGGSKYGRTSYNFTYC